MSVVLIACERKTTLETFDVTVQRAALIEDTLDCVLMELMQTHDVPPHAIVTIRVEFAEDR